MFRRTAAVPRQSPREEFALGDRCEAEHRPAPSAMNGLTETFVQSSQFRVMMRVNDPRPKHFWNEIVSSGIGTQMPLEESHETSFDRDSRGHHSGGECLYRTG